ncbi:hypothetical protein [Parafilimonas sp.]|uniref:hypothetical protein n=1 Tax=Parafilimonas sp. TaxID=1969739 RepID=UPI0039E499F1
MKNKFVYPLLAGVVLLTGAILLLSMTRKTPTPKKAQTGVACTFENNSSATVTSVKVSFGGNAAVPVPCSSCYPFGSGRDAIVTVTFSSAFSGAIEILDAGGNTLKCSPGGGSSTSEPWVIVHTPQLAAL